MTLAKESEFNYGLTGLKYFLDTAVDKPTTFQKTLNPHDTCLLNVAAITYHPGGTLRAGFVLKDQKLFYKYKINQDSVLIPCGTMVFKY